jgi:signal transduction histidine kinase
MQLAGTGTRLFYLFVALGAALFFAMFIVAETSQGRLRETTQAIAQAQQRQSLLSEYLRLLREAETALRGFLLSNDGTHLEQLDRPIAQLNLLFDQILASYEEAGLSSELVLAKRAEESAGARLGTSLGALRVYAETDLPTALALLNTDIGARKLNEVRTLVTDLQQAEMDRVLAATADWQDDFRRARLLLGLMTALSIALLVPVGIFFGRDLRRREELAADTVERNQQLDRIVEQRTAMLSSLSSYLQRMTEVEKASLARELHDELGGLLVATKMDVAWLRRESRDGREEVIERWDRVLRLLDEGLELKRRVIESLRPTLLDNLGLVPALQWLVAENVRRAGIRCVEDYPDSLPELSPDASIAVFRVVQECLTNIMKHARATEVLLAVHADESTLTVTVRDNGAGVDEQCLAPAQSHGLLGMRHRIAAFGGTFDVRPLGPGVGTEVSFTLAWERIRKAEDEPQVG